jgi:hypothetical protein
MSVELASIESGHGIVETKGHCSIDQEPSGFGDAEKIA